MFNSILFFFFNLPRTKKLAIFSFVDCTLIFVAYHLSLKTHGIPIRFDFLGILLPLTTCTFLYLTNFYRNMTRFINYKALLSIIFGITLSSLIFLIDLYFNNLNHLLFAPLNFLFISIVFIFGSRFITLQLYLSNNNENRTPIAIYGAGEAGKQLFKSLQQNKDYIPSLFIDDSPEFKRTQIGGLKIIPFSNTPKYIKKLNIRMIFFAIPSLPKYKKSKILKKITPLGIKVKTLPGLDDLIDGKVAIQSLRSIKVDDLLGRDPVKAHEALLSKNIKDQTVLVTGAGGSIGQELCRQVLSQHPKKLILLDHSEFAIYQIYSELTNAKNESLIIPKIISVTNKAALVKLFETYQIDTIYHAAAYKHVPLIETNASSGIINNSFGTLTLLNAAIKGNVKQFTLISTDKAVRPTNLMGASKRLAELICQAYANHQNNTLISMVRFGNVLGSSGSVIPLFEKQIEAGGPITLTHPEINRYFMTIEEASQLVIQASNLAKGGDVFLLDMGKPVKIIDLAKRMVLLQGHKPFMAGEEGGDIEIIVTGLRQGEKLFEELLIDSEANETIHSRIYVANEAFLTLDELLPKLKPLYNACYKNNVPDIIDNLEKLPISYIKDIENV